MKQRTLAIAVAMSGLLLGGCASPLANKTADVAAVQTMEHNAQGSYNFDGVVRVSALHLPAKLTQSLDKDLVEEVAKSFSMDLRGAVDLKQSRLELVPTLRFARPNVETWLRVPMLLELNSLTLWVDASAFDLASPVLRGENKGKLIKVQAPQDKIKNLPIDAMLAELPRVTKNIYAAIDKKAYTFQPLDEQARQMGASYRIRLTLDPAAELKMSKQVVIELAELAKRHSPDKQKEIEAMVKGITPLLDASRGEVETSSQTDLLVSRSGTLLAMVARQKLGVPKEKELEVSIESVLRLSNHGKPVFSLHPTADNVVNFADLKRPAWLGGKNGAEDASAEDEGTEHAMEVPAAEVNTAPIAKTRAVLKPKPKH